METTMAGPKQEVIACVSVVWELLKSVGTLGSTQFSVKSLTFTVVVVFLCSSLLVLTCLVSQYLDSFNWLHYSNVFIVSFLFLF